MGSYLSLVNYEWMEFGKRSLHQRLRNKHFYFFNVKLSQLQLSLIVLVLSKRYSPRVNDLKYNIL